MPKALVVGHDSELGGIARDHLHKMGWQVVTTSRRSESLKVGEIFHCDFNNRATIAKACEEILGDGVNLDLVIVSIGFLNPIGKITEINFEEWASSIEANFINQVFLISEIVQGLRNKGLADTKFLTFAGSGTNSAPLNFSSYTLSKIALIKSMELFAAEHPDFFFLSLGTGWMRSAIHEQTLKAGALSGQAYSETIRRIKEDDFGSPQMFLDFIDWYISTSDKRISGRNIALQGDSWNETNFEKKLVHSENAFKLRRVSV
jgi:NAD(P)-dependent dehydrogenase (short-subunit alcohol dehydrogenase family)